MIICFNGYFCRLFCILASKRLFALEEIKKSKKLEGPPHLSTLPALLLKQRRFNYSAFPCRETPYDVDPISRPSTYSSRNTRRCSHVLAGAKQEDGKSFSLVRQRCVYIYIYIPSSRFYTFPLLRSNFSLASRRLFPPPASPRFLSSRAVAAF